MYCTCDCEQLERDTVLEQMLGYLCCHIITRLMKPAYWGMVGMIYYSDMRIRLLATVDEASQ